MAELEELEQADLDEKLLDVGPVADNLPSVPTTEPQASRKGNKRYVLYDLDNRMLWAS